MKHYQPNRRGFIVYVLIAFALLPIVTLIGSPNVLLQKPLALALLVSPFALVLWIYISTSYRIDQKTLYYRSGFLKGTIDIQKIREILKDKTMWSGTTKAALARKGMIIKYNTYDEVYIAPVSNEEMIADLLAVNSDIKTS